MVQLNSKPSHIDQVGTDVIILANRNSVCILSISEINRRQEKTRGHISDNQEDSFYYKYNNNNNTLIYQGQIWSNYWFNLKDNNNTQIVSIQADYIVQKCVAKIGSKVYKFTWPDLMIWLDGSESSVVILSNKIACVHKWTCLSGLLKWLSALLPRPRPASNHPPPRRVIVLWTWTWHDS